MHVACYMDENGHNTIPSRRLWNRKQKVESSFHFPHTSSSICPFVITQAWRGTPTAVSLGQTHSHILLTHVFCCFPLLFLFSFLFLWGATSPFPTWFPSSFDTLSSCICPLCTSCLCFPATLPSPNTHIHTQLCMLCGPLVGFCDTALLCLDGTSQSETVAADYVYRHAVFFFTRIYRVL